MSEHPTLARDESFHLMTEEQLSQLFLPRSAWKSDQETTRCFGCNNLFFLFFRRKHHCRKCGNIFCSKCSNCFFDTSSLKLNIFESKIRLCNLCYSKFDDFRKFLTKEVKQIIKPEFKQTTMEFIDEENKQDDEINFINSTTSSAFDKILDGKLDKITTLAFKNSDLYDSYYKLLVTLIKVALNEVRPNSVFWGDSMDINNYIKIKKIPYFDTSETKYIRGVVFHKSLLDRKMNKCIENAQILLFSSIDVDNCEGKFASFDSFISQEQYYFKKIAKNITKFKPNVIFIEKTIHRYAADYLKNQNIAIFVKIKRSLMHKIARITRSKIIKDITKLKKIDLNEYMGKSSSVYVKKISILANKKIEFDSESTKDFVFIEGCNPIYGVTITISGPDINQLKTLKSTIRNIFKIGRNWLLEQSIINVDQSFLKEVNGLYYLQKNFSKDFDEVIDETLIQKTFSTDSIIYTKATFIKGDINSIPDFEKNPYLLHDLEVSLEQDGENSVLKTSKLNFFAEICGYPSLKNIKFYSDDDISVGSYVLLKANSLYAKCSLCLKPKSSHIAIYYRGDKYIKIIAESAGIKKYSPNKYYKKLDEMLFRSKSKDRKITEYNALTPRTSGTYFNFTPPQSSQNLELLPHNNQHLSEKITGHFKPKFSLFCMNNNSLNQIKSSDNLHNFEIKLPRTKTMGNSPSPAGTPRNNINKNNCVITCLIECADCGETICELQNLPHEYLEYSLAYMLQRMFEETFSKEESYKEINEQEISNISNELECRHLNKMKVFQYEEIKVKFFVSYSKFYQIDWRKNYESYKKETVIKQNNLIEKKKNECLEVFEKCLGKLSLLIESFSQEEFIKKMGTQELFLHLLKKVNLLLSEINQKFSVPFQLLAEIEQNKAAICKDIIICMDIFICLLRIAKKTQFVEFFHKFFDHTKTVCPSSEINNINEIDQIFCWRTTDFYPKSLVDYVQKLENLNISEERVEEKNNKNNMFDQNLKYSVESSEYLFEVEYELTLNKKLSDLMDNLFIEKKENFKEKFLNDEAFQMKHLEIEFKEFLKIAGGRYINFSDSQNLRFFQDIPINKLQPLSLISHTLNSSQYIKEVYQVSKNIKNISEIKNSPKSFEFQINLLENFISTLALTFDPKKHFIYEHNFLSEQNISFPRQIKNVNFMKVIIYFPVEFEVFRSNNSINLKEFINSLAESAQCFNEPNIAYTFKPHLTAHDEYFRFKTLKKNQFQMFLSFAHRYFSYISACQEANQPSLLNRIHGAFQINFPNKTFYYLCMDNLLAGVETTNIPWRQYELKGCMQNRYLVKDRLHRALLDNNFHIDRNNEPLPLKIEDKRLMDRTLEKDVEFLKNLGIIDYSLLLIENREKMVIRIGIIDYFNSYKDKIAENKKENGNTLNCVDYANRFKKAMKKNFMEIFDEK